MKIRIRQIALIFTLLLLGGMANEALAHKVTYYILTLPLNHETGTKNTKEALDGKRVAAIKAIDAIGTEVGLDEHLEHFKSPLAKNFSYFDASIVKYDGAKQMYVTHTTKYPLYVLNLGEGPISPYIQVTVSSGAASAIFASTESEWNAAGESKKTATTKTAFDSTVSGLADGTYYFKICLDERSAITANCDIFVTYEYNPDNGIAKLDGSESYNIEISGGFVAYNKGRNNRMAVIPAKYSDGTDRITGEQLSSKQFVQVDVTGTSISPWWNGNLTPKDRIYSYYHFLFKYEGEDPYNITIRSAYEDEDEGHPDYYIELYGSSDSYSVNKLYEGSSIFAYRKGTDQSDELLLASDDNKKYTTANDNKDLIHTVGYTEMPGFYRNLGGAIWNSFAMLNNSTNTGYVFMGTKCVKSDGTFEIPSESKKENGYYKYYYFNINDQNKLYYTLQTATTASNKSSSEPEMFEVHTYLFKVKTPFGNVVEVEKEWSEAYGDQNLTVHIPDALKRKYVTFTGAYKEEGLGTSLTTFADADANATRDGDKRVIWLKYETTQAWTNLLETLPVGGNYEDARFYTIRMNAENRYIPYFDTYTEDEVTKYRFSTVDGSGNSRGSNDASKVHQGEDSKAVQVAFIGDPFELRIVSHSASEDIATLGTQKYIGCTSGASDGDKLIPVVGEEGYIFSWEIVPDDVDGSIILRKFKGLDDATPMYIGWASGAANKPITYSSTANRLKIVELEKKKYYYHIKNSAGEIAVMASASLDVGKPLKYTTIPEIIRSPLIAPGLATLTFYSDAACTTEITHAPFDVTESTNRDIYVKYTITGAMPTGNYHVRLNISYVYYNPSTGGISWSDEPVTDNENPLKDCYIWHLDITDPYAMIINNTGITGDNKYVKVGSWTNEATLSWDVSANASKFIVKSNGGINYEVMAPTGDGVDASTTYYNIGRTDDKGVLMYSNSSYPHTYQQIRFALTPLGASSVDFHLIDKENKELLVVRRRTTELSFPDQYRSPLVSTYHYWTSRACDVQLASVGIAPEVGGVKQVYVTYDTNSLINLRKGQLYLLKFHAGDIFRQENGADDLIAAPGKQAVYPYCNGDCNFFVYGKDEYELQQQGAASTRTRWAWYVESATNDPYHVKICSRQLETYNDNDHQAYFYTSVQNFKYPNEAVASDHVVTSLAWPGITGVRATEYMVLGTVTNETRNFQLVTTPVDNNSDGDCLDEGEHPFYVVNSFEQYWKTFDTIKNKLLAKAKDPSDPTKNLLDAEDEGADPTGDSKIVKEKYRNYLTSTFGYHSYDYYAYAKRFNGYNASGETKKGWEKIEHWYQTINMGEGYFDFEATVIAPVLILLDQHGWEVMRKPLPYSDQDPDKEPKKNVLRTYDSPMVKEYAFWSTAKKRSGLHQYYQLDNRIGGSDYTSTSLGDLPTWGSENVLDAKGNQNDEYVTYIVKDEYAQTYDPSTKEGSTFLIQQGDHFASATNATTIKNDNAVPSPGGMSQYIINNAGSIDNSALWILKPNADIDNEQGYLDVKHDWGSNPNAYEQTAYEDLKTATYINDKTLGKFSFSNGFDPYNIQISSAQYADSYFYTNATGATLTEGDGAVLGTYSEDPELALGPKPAIVNGTWYDSRKLSITNATFMAVKDADGNMQLMPRFDQAHRVRNFGDLVTPAAEAGDPTKLPETHTKLFRPMVYNYHIIDNAGFESLRYQSGGDLTPQTPDHFKSPLAKDYTYYKNLTYDGSKYTEISSGTGISSKKLSKSFVDAGLISTAAAGNDVYVRYAYDEEADGNLILKGKWFTMKLNGKDAILNDGIKQGTSKPASVGYDEVAGDDDEAEKVWQWKFLENPLSNPDPYAVCMYNRNAPDVLQPAANTPRYALLSHTSGDYALVVTGSGGYTYTFLNGSGMTTSDAASLSVESGFKSTSCSLSEGSQVKLIDDVQHLYKYKIYTNDNNYAIEATQTMSDASDNDFMPVLPDVAKTPLLNDEDFRYYYNNNVWSPKVTVTPAMVEKFPELEGVAEIPDTIGKNLQYLYGLYDDVVYVHYMPYDANKSEYKVPNVRNATGSTVAKGDGSNDAGLGLNADQLYNIIWYTDNMMGGTDATGSAINDGGPQALQGGEVYVWTFEGSDPYAIKIKHRTSGKYAVGASGLSDTSTKTFMLLNKEGYDYGVLQVTGDNTNEQKLTGYGNSLTADAATAPNHFIIFALATYKVIYHLVIANTYYDPTDGAAPPTPTANQIETIPYWNEDTNTLIFFDIKGTTQRDLSVEYQLGETINGQNYSHDAGQISLGDKLEVPSVFYRPNVVYRFFVEGVYTDQDCDRSKAYGTEGSHIDVLDETYRGKELKEMDREPGLLGKVVRINIVYSFNGALETNAGADFVRSVAQNKWYTFEAQKHDGTPLLTQYTNAWGTEVKEGRGTHYTNDYLWTPLGDPYGFKMYHRYTCVNSGGDNQGEPKRVMTTNTNPPTNPPVAFAEGDKVIMGQNKEYGDEGYVDDPYSIYELLEGTTPGYFKIHPVANMTGTQYNFDIVNALEPGSSTVYHDYVRLSATKHTDFTFGLTEELVKPYYDRAGYVGGLNAAGKAAYEAAGDNLMTKQSVVYDPANIVKYEPGYYRLHSPEDIEVDGLRINPVRYASGYTHKLELTGGASSTPIPMHFYEVEGKSTQFNELKSKDGASVDAGYTRSSATQGDIPIPAVEYDPASIFYFYQGSSSNPLSKVQAQGLYLKGEKGQVVTSPSVDLSDPNIEDADERAAAIMTATEGEATSLYIMDIGGGILLIHDNVTALGRQYLKYLSYDQVDAGHIYDLKLTHNTHTDHAKWLMQPANHLGLRIKTHSGGDAGTYGVTYNYTTFYAPFDVLLPDTVFNKETPTQIDKIYHAVILESANSPWRPSTDDLHPKSIGRYNIEANGCPSKVVNGKELFRTNNRFVPAGTPVLLAMYDNAGYIKLTLPTNSPSPSLASSPETFSSDGFTADTRTEPGEPEENNKDKLGKRYNILSGQYLEQLLDYQVTPPAESGHRIYVFGLPYSGTMTPNWSTGEISATLPLQDNSGMGFYLNANPNKEEGLSIGDWTRNNWYVYANKVYYHETGVSSAPEMTRGVEFVPVIFGFDNDDEGEEELQPDGSVQVIGDGCIYDLLGRKVATREQVEDGTWRERLAPGIYILNGKKFKK